MSNRKYEETHPWLSFAPLDMREASPHLWMLLGEITSKSLHVAGVPLMPEVAQEFSLMYLSKGTLGTAAIEGNTLTEEEVRARIQGDLKLPPSREYLGTEVDNIVAACNKIAQEVYQREDKPFCYNQILEFNRMVMQGLEMDDGEPGVIRHRSVGVGRYLGAPPEDCKYLLQKMVEMLNKFQAPEGEEMLYGLLKATVAHVYFVWIHPFFDGNGRTARLIEFKILLQSGLPFPVCHLLSNHYNLTRERYYKELDKASKGSFSLLPFIEYSLEGLRDGLKEQLDKIRFIQWDLCWINFIHEKFKNKNTEAQIRRRHLMLDISRDQRNRVPYKELQRLTPRLAEHYSGKLSRTVARDVNALVAMGLLLREGNEVVAHRRQILSFLPASTMGIKKLF